MKIVSAIAKILAALAFIAGVVYLVATYGDKIVAWAKKLLPCKACEEEVIEETEEEEAEDEEVTVEIEVTEEAPEATETTEEAPVAEETDFAE